MSNPVKENKIPVAEHGLHRKDVNVPRLFTSNFFEHIPIMVRDFRKGGKIDVKYNFFNRLFPLPVPALVTGVTKLYGYFVPYQSIFKGWYHYITKTTHQFSDGTNLIMEQCRTVSMAELNEAFVSNSNLVVSGALDSYDISYLNSLNEVVFYRFTSFGTSVYKILCALGLPLSFDANDTLKPNCLKVLAYLRVMYDHYFPLQYFGNTVSNQLEHLFNDDTVDSLTVSAETLLDAIGHLLFGYFDNSFIESVWDQPVAPVGGVGQIQIMDQTNNSSVSQGVDNLNSLPNPAYQPSNGTPHVVSNYSTSTGTVVGSITQFVIDALQSVNNFIKRRGLSGNRLIENYLTQRGVILPSGVIDNSFKTDEYSVPFSVDDVENNSDVNLGELAGKAVSAGKDYRFRHEFTSDGIFVVIQAAIPDSEPMLAFDPYNLCVNPLDFQNGAFEKLGVEAVPSRVLYQNMIGSSNRAINDQVFGFFKRYWYDNVEIPLVFGDFRVLTRGAQQLNRYHTFRNLEPYVRNNNTELHHSYEFLRVGSDYSQFSRIFYTDKQDNMVCLGRFYGDRYSSGLPFGDSYDWDDDVINKKVEVLSSGNNDR